MKTFNNYIIEQELDISENMLFESETSNNAERKKQLENYLKGKKYSDYVETLNKMLEDPKAKVLLEDGFGGELGDTKLVFKIKKIPARNLRPTQSEIGVSDSLEFPLKHPENIDNYFTNKNKLIIAGMPIITFRGNYVIDGHHRWSQVFAFEPEAKLVCCDYDGDISPIQMLKATQGAIAAVKADDSNDNNGKIPSSKVKSQNLFDDSWGEKEIKKYVVETSVDEAPEIMHKYVESVSTKEELADYLAKNLIDLKSNNYPETGSPSRGDMPQTDRGGEDYNDKKSSMPNKEGSALNKLSKGKFVKKAVS